MPVSNEASQMSMLQQAMQQAQAQMQMRQMIQQMMQQGPQGQPSGLQNPGMQTPSGASQGPSGLGALLGGVSAMGAPKPGAPPTLGLPGQPIPMQMPQADPQGAQAPPPIPPDPEAMTGGGPQ